MKKKKPNVKSLNLNDLVKINWLDHYSATVKDIDVNKYDFSAVELSTVGWIIKETDDIVVLAQSQYKDKGDGNIMGILKSCIIGIKKLS